MYAQQMEGPTDRHTVRLPITDCLETYIIALFWSLAGLGMVFDCYMLLYITYRKTLKHCWSETPLVWQV